MPLGRIGMVPRARGGLRPSLDLSFMSGALPPGLVFSRLSNATVVGPDGALRWAPANYLRHTENLEHSLWGKLGAVPATVTPGQPDPQGGATAWLVDVSMSADSRVSQTMNVSGPPGGGLLTYAAWVRTVPGDADGTLGFSWRRRDASTQNGALPVTSQWTRVSVPLDQLTGGTAPLIWIANATVPGTLRRVLIWRPQISGGSVATDYLPTADAEAYGHRFDHNPATREPIGLLLEEQRTNYIVRSAAPVLGDWSKTGDAASVVSIVTDAVELAAAGLADIASAVIKLDNTAGTGLAYVTSPASSVTSGQMAASAWLRSTGPQLTTISADFAATQTNCATTSQYRRFAAAATPGSGASYRASFRAGPGSVLYIALPQYELGPMESTFIPTYGAAASRASDTATISGAGWLHQAGRRGVLFVEASCAAFPTSVYPTLAALGDGTSFNRMFVYASASAAAGPYAISCVGDTAGARDLNMGGPPGVAFGGVIRTALSYDDNDVRLVTAGGAPYVDASFAVPVVDRLMLGATAAAGTNLARHIRRVSYYSSPMATQQLQALTA